MLLLLLTWKKKKDFGIFRGVIRDGEIKNNGYLSKGLYPMGCRRRLKYEVFSRFAQTMT